MGKLKSPLKELRQGRGMSQAQMALLFGYSKTYISELELGNIKLTERFILVLDELGLDSKKLAREQRAFRDEKREELKQMFIGNQQS